MATRFPTPPYYRCRRQTATNSPTQRWSAPTSTGRILGPRLMHLASGPRDAARIARKHGTTVHLPVTVPARAGMNGNSQQETSERGK